MINHSDWIDQNPQEILHSYETRNTSRTRVTDNKVTDGSNCKLNPISFGYLYYSNPRGLLRVKNTFEAFIQFPAYSILCIKSTWNKQGNTWVSRPTTITIQAHTQCNQNLKNRTQTQSHFSVQNPFPVVHFNLILKTTQETATQFATFNMIPTWTIPEPW